MICGPVSEMDGGGDGATPGPASAMSVEEAWDLTQAEDDNPESFARKRDAILEHIKNQLKTSTPLQVLEKKFPSVQEKDQYARRLWQEFSPMASNPPRMRADLPGKREGELTAADVLVMHLATISFSGASMVCEPTIDKIMKLVDEILTDGFVTDTEPLILNVTPTQMEEEGLKGIPPWGAMVDGVQSLRPFSVCHHKSAARVIALHLLLNVFMEESQLLV